MYLGSSYFGNDYFGAAYFGGFEIVEPPQPFLGIGLDYTIPLAFAEYSIQPSAFGFESVQSFLQFDIPPS